jgi:hypothetical protein
LRALRVAPESVQLTLPDPDLSVPAERWWQLPEATRVQVLALLAGLIARCVVVEEPACSVEAGDD